MVDKETEEEKKESEKRLREEANRYSAKHWERERKLKEAIERRKKEKEFWDKTLGLNKKREEPERRAAPRRQQSRRAAPRRAAPRRSYQEPSQSFGAFELLGSSGGIDFGAYRDPASGHSNRRRRSDNPFSLGIFR